MTIRSAALGALLLTMWHTIPLLCGYRHNVAVGWQRDCVTCLHSMFYVAFCNLQSSASCLDVPARLAGNPVPRIKSSYLAAAAARHAAAQVTQQIQ